MGFLGSIVAFVDCLLLFDIRWKFPFQEIEWRAGMRVLACTIGVCYKEQCKGDADSFFFLRFPRCPPN